MSKKDKKKNKEISQSAVITEMLKDWDSERYGVEVTDVLGSYTGNPIDSLFPEQDADDL